MPDAAKGVRQLVLLHGRDAARSMVDPEADSLVRIASEVLCDDHGKAGYSYSGLRLTSLPHRRLADDQAWERTVGPLTLIIEPGRLKMGSGPSKLVGVPFGARARLILIYLQTQAVLKQSREISLGRSMREWMGRMGMSAGGETAATLARASASHRHLLDALFMGRDEADWRRRLHDGEQRADHKIRLVLP